MIKLNGSYTKVHDSQLERFIRGKLCFSKGSCQSRVASFPRHGKHTKITEIESKTENTENCEKVHFCN